MRKTGWIEKLTLGTLASALVYAGLSGLVWMNYRTAPMGPAGFLAAAPEGTSAPKPATSGGVDLAAGQKAFTACKACHSIDKGGKSGIGPNLWGLVGRPAASLAGFTYSPAMTALAGQPWDAAALDSYLTNPKAYAPGTKMTYAGLKRPGDRANLIAWLGMQSDTPAVPEGLDLAAAAAAAAPSAPADPFADLADDAVIDIAPVPYPSGVTYADPAPRSEAEMAAIAEKVAALTEILPGLDYQRARYHPLHFQPQIATASNEECLVCHAEILNAQPRETSLAGVQAATSLAWYQTLDTYAQGQADFHWRHMESDFAKQVMNLDCTFCHKGNDPREESPDMMPGRAAYTAPASPEFTLRKMVNPSETCLLCHGAYPATNMGMEGAWHDLRVDLETPEAPNGCLSCHAETSRTNRHAVTYLNAATIEDLARNGTSDTCFGCHGGRQWYRISYPYPRHPWPGMDPTVPAWAADRPTESNPAYQMPKAP